jgi:plasmid stability protein
MATIQIREIPEESYETLRRRARAAGQSLQAYMRDRVVEMASRPTKQEALAAIEERVSRPGYRAPSMESIAADIRAHRDA